MKIKINNTLEQNIQDILDNNGTSVINAIMLAVYPVGSIYMSVNNINPGTLFGGTWELTAEGRTLVGVDSDDTDFNTVQKTGGSKQHSLPLGNHGASAIRNYSDYTYVGAGATDVNDLWNMDGTVNNVWRWHHEKDANYSTNEGYTGVRLYGRTEEDKILPPYFTCYIWKRTA